MNGRSRKAPQPKERAETDINCLASRARLVIDPPGVNTSTATWLESGLVVDH